MEETGYLDTMNESEAQILAEVTKYATSNPDVPQEMITEWYLLRFCRARKFKLDKVIKMFSNFIEWKKKNELLKSGEIDMAQYATIKNNYCHGYYHTDKEGRPVYIEKVNELKPKLMFAEYTDEQLCAYYIQSYDRYFFYLKISLFYKFINKKFGSFDLSSLLKSRQPTNREICDNSGS